MVLSVFLFIILIVIALIPSGEQCPECESYATVHLKGKKYLESVKEQVTVEIKICYNCDHRWDKLVNGLTEQQYIESIRSESEEDE